MWNLLFLFLFVGWKLLFRDRRFPIYSQNEHFIHLHFHSSWLNYIQISRLEIIFLFVLLSGHSGGYVPDRQKVEIISLCITYKKWNIAEPYWEYCCRVNPKPLKKVLWRWCRCRWCSPSMSFWRFILYINRLIWEYFLEKRIQEYRDLMRGLCVAVTIR